MEEKRNDKMKALIAPAIYDFLSYSHERIAPNKLHLRQLHNREKGLEAIETIKNHNCARERLLKRQKT